MEKYTFTKMNGAGNDFIMFDLDENPGLRISTEFVKKICSRQYGIGADGVISIRTDDGKDFVMEYFNSDGSLGSLCGNGARCAIKFASLKEKFLGNETSFICNTTVYNGKIQDSDEVTFYLNQPSKEKYNFKIKAHNQLINASFVDTGSPHIVILITDILKEGNNPNLSYKNLSDLDVLDIGREIRYSKDFHPDGVNVNFIELYGDKLKIRTYERGVENETLACGTGSVAAAIVANKLYGYVTPVVLETIMGDTLLVEFSRENDAFKNISLTGPAKVNFIGTFEF
ncbi:MAG: diaminopimelate epimerase [Ignavibacteriaceae bacterium]|nr:diaminopimelate epimerase [Ignavibacteriaceae bacterium]HRI46720.1 diaminopimelate epimerase [Ignavibacteriaceae bacterium]